MQSMPIGANPQQFPQGGGGRVVGAGAPGFPGQGPNLQGPLAYLEKTASNIGEPATVRESLQRLRNRFPTLPLLTVTYATLFHCFISDLVGMGDGRR